MNKTFLESDRKIVRKKVMFRYSVKVHATLFVLSNILLFVLNLIFIPEILWIAFTFFAWLIGLAIHYLSYLLYARGVYPNTKRAMYYLITAYVFGIILLFVTNYITSGVISWAIYPAIFGGAAVFIYMILYFLFFKKKLTDSGMIKSRIDRAVEKEMQKITKKRESL